MLQKNPFIKIKFNISDYIRRKYIWYELHDYEEYIKREKEILETEISELNKQMIISNISLVYCEMGEYNKAIETIRHLDNYELNDNMTFVYYINSLTYYIYNNQEENVDYIYEESENIMKKFSEKYPDQVDLYKIKYFNFKGRYEDSLEILKLNRIKLKDNDYMNLLLADIAFNTEQYDEGYFIISEMCKEYNKKVPFIRKQIDILINMYMKNVQVEKDDSPLPISFDDKLWDKSKKNNNKTSIFFIYLSIKKICKVKLVKYAVIPILIFKFLCNIFFPLFYGKVYSEVFTSIIAFIFLTYFMGGLGYVSMKYIRSWKNKILPALIVSVMVINILCAFFIMDFSGNMLDLKYSLFKNPIEDSGRIEKFNLDDDKKGSKIELKIKNKIFIVYDYDYLYNYINSNFEKGEIVNVEYLPHTMKLINIKKI